MPKKVCPNGHIYDSSIYGDECPLCPKGAAVSAPPAGGMPGGMPAFESAGPGTHVTPPAGAPQMPGAVPSAVPGMAPVPDASGETQVRGRAGSAPVGGGTVIRQPGAAGGRPAGSGRKLVGFLVTYNRNPMGKAFNIYEGKNYIGRDRSCDISVPEDNQMSGRHMSILYRNVDNKFKYRDEQSSNGTFVNKELSDEGELENYDIVRLGSTVFIFIAIPKLG